MNILILMAGQGTRLKDYYNEPKPFIKVNGLRIIEWVIINTNLNCNNIFVAQKKAAETYDLQSIIEKYTNKYNIIYLDEKTEGAASTALKAKDNINNEEELIIINSDQYLECDLSNCISEFRKKNVDGGILTVQKNNDPKWSYVKTNELGYATEVAEKKPISTNATVGVYYWKTGSYFVECCEKMIDQDIRFNNEFYVCPVYNQAILDNKKIIIKNIDKLWPIGTIEEVKIFENYSKNLKIS